jgi:hypothetical protein
LLGSFALGAQQPTSASANFNQPAASAVTLPKDAAKLAALIQGSYYHPDELTSLDCAVFVDWAALFGSMKMTAPEERLKVLKALKVHSHAVRGKVAELAFDWAGGELTTKDQMENGMKQMVGGFYQMYWPMFATSLITKGDELKNVEPQPDGSAKVDLSSPGTSLVITVSSDGTPRHWELDSPAMKGSIDPEFTPSPKPVAGDMSRISGMKVVQRIGESNMDVNLSLDYQEVDGFFVPSVVSFAIVGAYSVPMEFSSCVATRAESVH